MKCKGKTCFLLQEIVFLSLKKVNSSSVMFIKWAKITKITVQTFLRVAKWHHEGDTWQLSLSMWSC